MKALPPIFLKTLLLKQQSIKKISTIFLKTTLLHSKVAAYSKTASQCRSIRQVALNASNAHLLA